MSAGTRILRSLTSYSSPGWTFVGIFADPPSPPAGHITQTRRDAFLGIVTHYRFVPADEASGE